MSVFLFFIPLIVRGFFKMDAYDFFRVLKKYTRMSQPETSPLGLPLHTMTVRLLEIVLDEEVRTFDMSEFQPLLRTAQYRPQQGIPEVWELVLGRCRGLRK